MDKLLEDKLTSQYPKLFPPGLSKMESLMCFGFDHDDGWYQLVANLCRDIQAELDKATGDWVKDFKVVQVKEKFGGLRFYTEFAESDAIDKLIAKAEHDSFRICEICGKEGTLRTPGWWVTRCDDCHKRAQSGATK